MRRRLLLAVASGIFFLSIIVPLLVFAERPTQGVGQWLQEFGVYTGFIEGDLKGSDDFSAVPLGLRIGFDLKPFTKKFGFEPKGYLQLVYEPFINTITAPSSNVEMGLGILLKYAYPLTSKFYPFVEFGTGPYYMTLQTREQSTQFNFIDQAGVGFYYFLRTDLAVNAEFRYRHISNAGIDHPNAGIEAKDYLVGLSWYF